MLSLLSSPALIFKLTSVCVQVSKEVTVCQTGLLEFLSDCCVCWGTCSSSLITTYLNYTCFQYWNKSPPSEIVSFFPFHAGLFSFPEISRVDLNDYTLEVILWTAPVSNLTSDGSLCRKLASLNNLSSYGNQRLSRIERTEKFFRFEKVISCVYICSVRVSSQGVYLWSVQK